MEESISEPKRKLASVQVVSNVKKHANANALELATILGWQVVVSMGEVKTGQKVVYCEIDSQLPGNAEWLPDAVRKRVATQKNKDWFIVKTIKLRGELSQGLIVPMNINEPIGTDMTEALGIKKRKEFAVISESKVGGRQFPTDILSKTEEIRIQSRPKLLQQLAGTRYYMTIKLDGTSGTFLIHPETDEFLVCSRNFIREKSDDVYWQIGNELENKLRKFPGLAIQGEICGPGIQKNPLNLQKVKLFVFNIIDIKNRCKLDLDNFKSYCEKMELQSVPIEEIDESFKYNIKELLAKAKGNYKSGHTREGLVIRSQDQSISFKVINNDFLLKKR